MTSPEDPTQTAIEQGPDHIPSREEILSVIGTQCEKFIVGTVRNDEKGICLLEAMSDTGTQSKPDETLFTYQRTMATRLMRVDMSDGVVTYSDDVAEMDPKTGSWVYKNKP